MSFCVVAQSKTRLTKGRKKESSRRTAPNLSLSLWGCEKQYASMKYNLILSGAISHNHTITFDLYEFGDLFCVFTIDRNAFVTKSSPNHQVWLTTVTTASLIISYMCIK